MRKPLSRICVVCCLIVLMASPLFASLRGSAPQYWDDAQSSSWLRLDSGYLRVFNLPIPLPVPIVDMFNDGPDPVESSEEETEEGSEEESEEDSSNSVAQPFDSSRSGTTPGPRQ